MGTVLQTVHTGKRRQLEHQQAARKPRMRLVLKSKTDKPGEEKDLL